MNFIANNISLLCFTFLKFFQSFALFYQRRLTPYNMGFSFSLYASPIPLTTFFEQPCFLEFEGPSQVLNISDFPIYSLCFFKKLFRQRPYPWEFLKFLIEVLSYFCLIIFEVFTWKFNKSYCKETYMQILIKGGRLNLGG